MARVLSEYLEKNLGILDLQKELQRLISVYNTYTGRYLFVYAADINKSRTRGIDVSLEQEDFYIIQDILRESDKRVLDFYIETPGGSGESAEEIARFLRKKFGEINFLIAGEAKSAGTILVLSGDNIYMTDTGSLGPIDAQIKIGRTVVSAHDYKEWVDQRRIEAETKGGLNPFDAVMVAQISPGELYGVINSLEFAKDLVKEWLENYKFKNWRTTRTRGIEVTEEMKKNRALEVADMFCNHTEWRTHGRSLKIEDLQHHLIIESVDSDPQLADIVYRIKTVIRLIFDGSTIYKLYFLSDFKLTKTFSVSTGNIPAPNPVSSDKVQKQYEGVEVQVRCPKCGMHHLIYGYLDINSDQIKDAKLKINPNISDNNVLVCSNPSCKFEIDLKPIKSQIETQSKRKVIFK